MNTFSPRWHADLFLKLLLQPCDDRRFVLEMWRDVQWDLSLRLGKENVILVRSFDLLEKMGIPISNQSFQNAVAEERQRIRSTVQLIAKISEICTREGIEFVFTKAFQHYPDMGHDVDLFVSERTSKIDALMIKTFGASRGKESLLNRVAGKATYKTRECLSPIEIHHGRLGHIGEYNIYPRLLIKNRKEVAVDGATTFIPSMEDQLIIQVIQRIYGHRYIRLSDIIGVIRTTRREDLDWGYITSTAKQIGIFDGLCCYLSYIHQIHWSLFKNDFSSGRLKVAWVQGRWGEVRFRDWYYTFPTVSVVSRIYLNRFISEVVSLNWEGMGRLCLFPLFAIIIGFRNLVRWRRSFFCAGEDRL